MRRREFLASAGVAGAVGLAGCGAISGGGDGADGLDQVTVETLDAPGSTAGEIPLPATGQVTLIDAFATWCAPCKPTLDRLTEARERLDGDVRFVSVTTEEFADSFTREDLADWWERNGGPWTVAHDAGGTLTRTVEATRLPTTVVTDPDRQVAWRHTGIPKADTVVEEVEAARS